MATVSQVYTLINSVAAESYGESAVTVKDTASLVALGDKVLSSSSDTDRFFKALADRIGRTVFSVRRYDKRFNGLVREPFEYGCILQKIYVDIPDARKNNAWTIGDNAYTPVFAPVIKPTVKQKLFDKISTWEVAVTIPWHILSTAFLSETAIATLVDAIFVAMENGTTVALENVVNLTRATMAAHKINNESALGAINLLEEYNTETNESLTVTAALRSTDFLKWAGAKIALYTKRLPVMSTLFNDEGYKRHTPPEMLVVDVLADFASAYTTYLQADTFNADLTALPYYNEVPFWQGCGTSYDFNSVSNINIKIDATHTVNKSGIVCIMYDHDAMGVTINQPRTTTETNSHDEYTNTYQKSNIGLFTDLSENCIVFYLEET